MLFVSYVLSQRLDADKNRIPNANPSLWEVFYEDFNF